MNSKLNKNKAKLSVKELVLFSILGALMYACKAVMEILPNIHLVGVFIVAITVVFRSKAIYPIYAYVFTDGIISGFAIWWIPYLYIWAVLWGAVMLLPQKLPQRLRPFIYMAICSVHGFMFGVLYAPMQALFFGLDLKGTITWIAAGLPFDIIHGISNFFCGMLICPIIGILRLADSIGKH